MSTLAVHDHGVVHHDDGHEHHHKDTFITKYVFSQDHKMIAKQFLITGITMAVIAMTACLSFSGSSWLILIKHFRCWKLYWAVLHRAAV